jgi:hypothetical protein
MAECVDELLIVPFAKSNWMARRYMVLRVTTEDE